MTIDIEYKEYTLFDIEYYQAKDKTNTNEQAIGRKGKRK